VTPGRMEAFSDGVLAILITIMVLELPTPGDVTWSALRDLVPVLLAYLLSFVYLGIYWNNHHHMLKATRRVNGTILWANLHLLFWLSLVPAATRWLSGSSFAEVPAAVYGIVLLAAAVAYFILQTVIIRSQQPDSLLARAVGGDRKGKLSPVLYAIGIGLAFVNRWLAVAVFAGVALMWLVPDRRVETALIALSEPGG
jgi:uncharacterized membrane protein